MITDTSAAASIQIVDDNPQNLAVLTALLAGQGYEVRTAINGALALQSAQRRPPDLILLDVRMPDLDGYQVCEQLKADDGTRDVPVIFISAADQTMDKVRAFSVGGVDYVTKPFQAEEVLAHVKTHLTLRNAQRQLVEQNDRLQRANDALTHEIAERIEAESMKRELMHALGERVKELNCLYGISRLVETPGISLSDILYGTADLIPPSWQYPEVACARISLDGQVFGTDNFDTSPWQQTADILVHGEKSGIVQVGYLQPRPQHDQGPFLKEEKNLINAIAERLGRVAERVQAESALRESEALWRSLTESSPDHILTLGTDLNIQYANFASPGLTVQDLIGTPLHTYVEEERQAEIKSLLQGVLESGTPDQYETVYHTPDGDVIHYESRVTPHRLSGSDEIVGLTLDARDITERVQNEAQKERLAALDERERIGRELHDDLGQVMSYVNVQAQTAQVLLERGQTEQAQAILDQLALVAQDAHDDVRRYILGIRTAPTQPTPNFFEELKRYLHQLRERYGLETRVSWPDELLSSPLAPGVETQLLRIIQESLTNVRKHAGVSTARLLFTLFKDEVQVLIEDQGCGYSLPSVSLFQREGGHFGLTIMRERAEAVGGSLQVRSRPGDGTQVIVRLPRALESSVDKALGGVRVLLVDDHVLYLEGLRNMLSARGVQVVGLAHDGLQAQELARKLSPDLILMDVHMPHCDGLEAARRIKADLPDIDVVMLTVSADDDVLFTALKNGASGYLLKNLAGKQFFDLLAEVMRGETVLSPSLAARVLTEFAQAQPEPGAQATQAPPALTARQRQVLELVAQGLTNKEITKKLNISLATVKYHISHILERLHLKSRYELAQYAQGPPSPDEQRSLGKW